ncbi:MAG: 4-(cytidine 5'-diphospho)-2-C-methyl-D-erythritol kinase [Actinomycetota bacterium]|nr:4-(cytidine 5'-diphospho)-2-C-methyl-D-erythritol kinase [Actinomycetota bacterium]
MMINRVMMEAPAKINLYLEVGGRRQDGYHFVRTLMQAVELMDLVEVELSPAPGGVELEVEGDAPSGEENLCHRAAGAFMEAVGRDVGVRIRLVKCIPVTAGLGGGSADAAAVLRALNYLMEEALNGKDMFRLAASVGSDVPFFLLGGTVRGEGRGERVTPLAQAPPLPVILANTGDRLSTSEVYSRFDRSGGGKPPPGALETLVDALPVGDIGSISRLLFNSLQRTACEMTPSVGELLAKAEEAAGEGFLLSGSGPTVFILASGEAEAEVLEKTMRRAAPVVIRTRFRNSGVRITPA